MAKMILKQTFALALLLSSAIYADNNPDSFRCGCGGQRPTQQQPVKPQPKPGSQRTSECPSENPPIDSAANPSEDPQPNDENSPSKNMPSERAASPSHNYPLLDQTGEKPVNPQPMEQPCPPCPSEAPDTSSLFNPQELDIIAQNPSRTFVYLSQEVVDVINSLPKDSEHAPISNLMKHIACDNRTAPQDPVVEALECCMQVCSNEPEKCQVIESYKKQIESGEAVISLDNDEPKPSDNPSQPMKRSVSCPLAEKECGTPRN